MITKGAYLQLSLKAKISSLFVILAISILASFYLLFFQNSFNFVANFNQNEYPKCALCDIHPLYSPSSTKRDLVLTATTSRINRVEMLVRSLRSVGSKARIVVLIPNGMQVPQNITDCGVDPIEMSEPTTRIFKSPHKTRWEWYYEFLSSHQNEFDRVLHTDAFDAFFQADPFQPWVRQDTLYVAQEAKRIEDCPINQHWVRDCHSSDVYEMIAKKLILCSGSLMGGIIPFLKVCKGLISQPTWKECWGKGFDQGEFNTFIYTNYSKTEKIEYLGCNSPFLTMSYCSSAQFIFFDPNRRLLSPSLSRHPIYVHQYNRYHEVDQEFQRKCGVHINRSLEKLKASQEKKGIGK